MHLAATKALGVMLGKPNGSGAFLRAGWDSSASADASKANADAFAESLRETLESIREDDI